MTKYTTHNNNTQVLGTVYKYYKFTQLVLTSIVCLAISSFLSLILALTFSTAAITDSTRWEPRLISSRSDNTVIGFFRPQYILRIPSNVTRPLICKMCKCD